MCDEGQYQNAESQQRVPTAGFTISKCLVNHNADDQDAGNQVKGRKVGITQCTIGARSVGLRIPKYKDR